MFLDFEELWFLAECELLASVCCQRTPETEVKSFSEQTNAWCWLFSKPESISADSSHKNKDPN